MLLAVRWRRVLVMIFLILLAAILTWIYWLYRPPYALYDYLTEKELQSARASDSMSNKSAKFVLFNQLQGAGFNNQVQEILIYHHLSLPFIWRPRFHQPLPLSAFLPGPTIDGVPVSFLEQICPQDDTVYIQIDALYDDLWRTSQKILARPEKCIIITNRIMHWNYLSSSALSQVWPSFQQYLGRYFAWSPQILDITRRTQKELRLRPHQSHYTQHDSSNQNQSGDSYMALHIRRGDFKSHCASLASSQTPFTTWASLSSLRDSRILSAITLQAQAHPHVRTLHILHDASIDHPNVYIDIMKLKAALTNPDWAARNGWGESGPMRRITESSMIPIKHGEYDFTVAVDMELARWADVFVGNGYSSLSSQVVAMKDGVGGWDPEGYYSDMIL
ncbi:hypothetical protein BT96DRAFT_962330 [Gymnopus androsaceus JB14]|uniref:Uncharacterized protein n=1 Tax=Gymnopus androsaceus JB14 TaxID=1447944 RepID=A0A6A4IEU0_9AGAR|nr:hypothetical protein BT96DRAFT_962330 [Gymnopus androsaceus JB14]